MTRRLVQDGLRGLALVAALVGPACTPLVNADRFRNVLGALEPAAVEEGEGGPVFLGRGVPLLLLGGSFDDVKVSADDTRIRFSTPMVADGAMSVLAWIPALPELGAGETATVTVTVGERTFPLLIHGLPELSLAGTVDARSLAPRYSEIRSSGPVTFTGDAVPFLVASGAVVLEHPISVAASGTRAGPQARRAAGGPAGAGARGGRGGGQRGERLLRGRRRGRRREPGRHRQGRRRPGRRGGGEPRPGAPRAFGGQGGWRRRELG
ncbi:MAG: hypothetical protein H6730_07835 [Deltaproteobacteria bacterium]|nr:hypothetical protein [Deltaproteobacteria bacterium]